MNAITIAVTNGQATTTSNQIAEHFGKRHDTVLRAIDNLDCSTDYRHRNFAETFKTVAGPKGASRQSRTFTMTRDGFAFLCMGFTGKAAAQWKEKYIAAFNAMEAKLKHGVSPTPLPAPVSDEAINAAAVDELTRPGRRFCAVFWKHPETNAVAPVMTVIPDGAIYIQPDDLAGYIGDAAGSVSRKQLLDIINAAVKRLSA